MPEFDIGMDSPICACMLPKLWLMLVGRYPFSELGEASSREPRWSSPS